jgi:hypothetical protein
MLPSGFVKNCGQYENGVKFYARTNTSAVFVSDGSIVYSLPTFKDEELAGGMSLKETFVGSNECKVVGNNELGIRVNCFKGNDAKKWKVHIPSYSSLDFGEIFEGVNLSVFINNHDCEKLFTVQPHAELSTIRISISGIEALSISSNGELLCDSGFEVVRFSSPVAYQHIDNRRNDVTVKYTVQGNKYGFAADVYNPAYPLVIDPLLSSTYLGGSNSDRCVGMLTADTGDIYVAGYTYSIDFPTTVGSFSVTHSGGDVDLFVSLIDKDLTTLISSTFIGGSDDEWIHDHTGLIETAKGDLYIAAQTYSTDFPTSVSAFDRISNGMLDAVVFCLNGTLDALSVSTYLGGVNDDGCGPIAIDEEGNVYVAGLTWGIDTDFPTTKGAYDRVPADSWDTFISRFDPDLSSLVASTLLGGWLYDRAKCLVCDNEGGIYVAGGTASNDFPTTPGAFDETFNHDSGYPDHDMFISHFDTELTTLNASTFIGGVDEDMCMEIILDDEDSIVLAGHSNSRDFPTTPGVYQEQLNAHADFVAARISRQLDQLIASTFVGGEGPDYGNAAALDDAGYIVVAGWTNSEDVPVSPGAHGTTRFKDPDAYIVRLDENLQRLTAATILGGNDLNGNRRIEECLDIDLLDGNKVIVCGRTPSHDFPTTSGSFSEVYGGDYDGFISIYDELLTLNAGKVVVGPGSAYDNPPFVRVYPAAQDATYGFEFCPYGPPHYGVNVCCGNLDQDDPDEIITGAGPGEIYGPHVRAFEIDGAPMPGMSFLAYGTLRWGVNVAAGDIDADGFDEIITGAGPGEVFGPHVRAWDYDGTPGVTTVPGVSFFAYGTPKWGVNVSAGDIDGDGFDEIVTGAGPGAVYGPHVRGWNVDGGGAMAIPGVSFLAYGTNKFGVNVSCGDLDGDGIDEIVTGAGPGSVFGAHIRCWNFDGASLAELPGSSFFAWPPESVRYGVNVSSGTDLDNDGRDELIAGSGPDPAAGTAVKVFTYDGTAMNQWFSLDAFPDLSHGVNVAAGRF